MAKLIRLIDPEKSYTLGTDVSNIGLSVVLIQEEEECFLYPTANASKSLVRQKKNYSNFGKDNLGLVWAVKYFPYLWGKEFLL